MKRPQPKVIYSFFYDFHKNVEQISDKGKYFICFFILFFAEDWSS